MFSWLICIKIIVLIFIVKASADFGVKSADNYGPYTVTWENGDPCRGPKSLNATHFNTALFKQPNGYYRYTINITYLENVYIDEIKMRVYTMKDNKKNILWNVNVNKPCSHYMLAAMLETYFGISKDCLIKKSQTFADLPLTELIYKYTGTSFFYGDYYFKVVVVSKKANLACLLFDPKFTKKVTHNNKT